MVIPTAMPGMCSFAIMGRTALSTALRMRSGVLSVEELVLAEKNRNEQVMSVAATLANFIA